MLGHSYGHKSFTQLAFRGLKCVDVSLVVQRDYFLVGLSLLSLLKILNLDLFDYDKRLKEKLNGCEDLLHF